MSSCFSVQPKSGAYGTLASIRGQAPTSGDPLGHSQTAPLAEFVVKTSFKESRWMKGASIVTSPGQ